MSSSPARRTRPRVLIVGSGFGGLFTAQALRDEDVDVTVIARTSHHLFQPLLYQVATGILSPGEIAPPTREVLSRQANAEVLLGEVTDVDLRERTVTARALGVDYRHGYDRLVVAAGALQSWFGRDEFSVHAPGMKTIDDALELRGRIFGAYELAELAAAEGRPESEVRRLLTFVVVGAGPTGVEMAGQLAELARRTLRRDFRHIDPHTSRILLLDAAPRLLATFHEELQEHSRRALEDLGIEVRLGAKVVGVDARGLDLEDEAGQRTRIEASTKVWAAGVAASPLASVLAEEVGLEVDRQGRVPVQPDLTLPGHPEVHVIGDMAALDGLPGVAQVAIQGGRHAAAEISRALRQERTGRPFVYNDKGNMATISRFEAIAEIGRVRLTGYLAWLSWLVVHLFYIIGFKSQVSTLMHWVVTFAGRSRSERTVTQQQIFGRLAMDQGGWEIAERTGREQRDHLGEAPGGL